MKIVTFTVEMVVQDFTEDSVLRRKAALHGLSGVRRVEYQEFMNYDDRHFERAEDVPAGSTR